MRRRHSPQEQQSPVAIPRWVWYKHKKLEAMNLSTRVASAPIAQLDRVTDYESVGRVFESPWAHQ